MLSALYRDWVQRRRARQELHQFRHDEDLLPWLPDEVLKSAKTKLGQGDVKGALLAWQAVRTQSPGKKAAYSEPIRELNRLGRVDEAERLIHEGLGQFPDDPTFYAAQAQLAQTRGELDEAMDQWRAVRERFPTYAAAYTRAAKILSDQGRLDEADSLLSKGLEQVPNSVPLLIGRAEVAQARKQWAEALSLLEQVCQTQAGRRGVPLRIDVLRGIVKCLRELGREDETEEVFEQMRTSFPEQVISGIEFARCAERRQDWPEAMHRWEWVRDMHPSDARGPKGCERASRQLARAEKAKSRSAATDSPA
jgi:tetratricopeptide (TPR) repeat protein